MASAYLERSRVPVVVQTMTDADKYFEAAIGRE